MPCQAEKMLREFDTDGSRGLEFAEFEAACRKSPQLLEAFAL